MSDVDPHIQARAIRDDLELAARNIATTFELLGSRPATREISLAVTNAEQALMWAEKAVELTDRSPKE